MIENERSFAMTIFFDGSCLLTRNTADENFKIFPFDQGCADNDLDSDLTGLKLK